MYPWTNVEPEPLIVAVDSCLVFCRAGGADPGGGNHTGGDRDRGHQPDEPMTSMHSRPSLLVLHGCRVCMSAVNVRKALGAVRTIG